MTSEATLEASSRPDMLRTGFVPSSSAIFQEGTKISGAQQEIPTDEISKRLGLDQFHVKVDLPPSSSNLLKVKALQLATARAILSGSTTKDTQRKAIEVLTANPAIRTSLKGKASTSTNESTPESARQIDLSLIRGKGGRVLEKRVLDGQITREKAVAISLSFDMYPGLGVMDKALIVNAAAGNPNITVGTFRDVVQTAAVLEQIIGVSERICFPRITPENFPISSISDDVKNILSLYEASKNQTAFERKIREFAEEEKHPDKIGDLRDVLKIVRNDPSIKVVSFDLYDTLVQWTSNQGERRGRMDELGSHILRDKYGVAVSETRFNEASSRAWNRRWVEFQEKGVEIDIKETIGWMVDELTTGLSSQRRRQIISDLEKTWYKVELDTAAPMPGALDTLKGLKSLGKKVGLTSNASWSRQHVERVLKSFGLFEYFDSISISIEHGKMKHPSIADFFHHSWAKLGVKPAEVLHVGDNPWADVAGAKNAGAKTVLYQNPSAFSEIETNEAYWKDPALYARRALEFHTKEQNSSAVEYINNLMEKRGIPAAERERLGVMAREVYQKTRDVVGPAYIALADALLTRLSEGKTDLVLALARDGLPLALTQKLLLNLEPERYKGAKPKQIKYLHVSRRFLDRVATEPEFAKRYQAYLRRMGAFDARNVTVTDLLSGTGKTHEGVQKLLPGKNVEGFYMDLHTERTNAHSFLKETLGDPSAFLTNDNMLLLFEALFSGPLESAQDLRLSRVGELPTTKRKVLPKNILLRGLSEQGLLMLNAVAIKGLMDAVYKVHRRRLLNQPDQDVRDAIYKFYAFIKNRPSPAWVDIWRSLPWQDYGKWYVASKNPNETAISIGKI